jgi:8-oxo-dGTP pyrophosphatase MutT (NUDIX family)
MEELHHWRTTSEKTIYKTNIFSLEELERTEDVSGKTGTFYVVNAPSWVMVIAITKDGKFVLVDQFRHGTSEMELELTAGDIEPGEDPSACALRELKEETGYIASETSIIECIGTVKPNPAFLNNTCYTYLITDVVDSGKQSFDEHERINVLLASEDEIVAMIRSGRIDHALVLDAYLWYKLRNS